MVMTSSSFLLGEEPLPGDAACAIGTCVAAMTQLKVLGMLELSLHVFKALAERTVPLDNLIVYPPGVNWVSVSVFCQCAHNTVLLVAVCSVQCMCNVYSMYNVLHW